MSQLSGGSPLTRFFTRYKHRTLIIHHGFPPNWLSELLKQPGGGGHFRIDIANVHDSKPTPVEWVIRQYIMPLELPLPILIQVANDNMLYLRHLMRNDHMVHPSELFWILEEIATRHHACLCRDGATLYAKRGMPLTDNEPQAMLDNF
jgi:hypothetical protein